MHSLLLFRLSSLPEQRTVTCQPREKASPNVSTVICEQTVYGNGSQAGFAMTPPAGYILPMRKRESEWEVIRLRYRGEHLGVVKAADEKAALKAAVKLLALRPVDEKALLVRPAR